MFSVVIDSVDTVVINGVELKRQYTSPVLHSSSLLSSEYLFRKPLIEKIGAVGFNMHGTMTTMPLMYHGELRCYQDDALFYKPVSIECDYINSLSVEEHNMKNQIMIYPNPTKSWVNLELKEEVNFSDFDVIITDMSGKIVKMSSFDSQITKINTSNLQSGNYIVHFIEKGNLVNSQKLILN